MKKALITGISGFAGSHLAELLVHDRQWNVSGIHATDRHLDNLSSIKDSLQLEKVNLLDAADTNRVIEQIKPDIIFHLAALASVGKSFTNPLEVMNHNIASEFNILEAVKTAALPTKIVIVSSAQVYGFIAPEDLPVRESVSFKPDNPYAVSKITQEYLALQYYFSYKMPIILLRPFNHVGPRLSTEISLSRFAKLIAEIEKGIHEPILTVGNLSAKRDFTDVRDMVRAYALASEKCIPGEVYNIGTGKNYSIKEMLDKLLMLSKVKITVKEDPVLLRPSDIPELRADAGKFMKITGWKPEIAIEKTLEDTLDYWRRIV